MRTNMNLGQTVRFLGWRDGQLRSGKVVAMKDTQVTLHEEGTRRERKLPYAAIEPPLTNPQSKAAAAPATAPPIKASREDFRCGEKVSCRRQVPPTASGHRGSHQPANGHCRHRKRALVARAVPHASARARRLIGAPRRSSRQEGLEPSLTL